MKNAIIKNVRDTSVCVCVYVCRVGRQELLSVFLNTGDFETYLQDD